MIELKNQMNNVILMSEKPIRIISLVPSQTELLFDLGLNEEVIGITKFCIHPDKWFRNKTRIGGTKTVDIEKVKALSPDLIIANKEENEQSQIEELQKLFPVFVSDIYNLNDSLEMIKSIGQLTSTLPKAQQIIESITQNFLNLKIDQTKKTCLYLIWRLPYMTSGKNTFVNDMLDRCGFKNLSEGRYPEISTEEICSLNPEYILLSSEPYPFKEIHMNELKQISPSSKIILVDGEYFSWYGSRLIDAPSYFKQFIV